MFQLFDREAFWLGMGFPYSLDSVTGLLTQVNGQNPGQKYDSHSYQLIFVN